MSELALCLQYSMRFRCCMSKAVKALGAVTRQNDCILWMARNGPCEEEIPSQVQQWQPYVWLYCQNENLTSESVAEILPLLQYGGELVNLENIGRESHSFLQHITGHYHDLADYTLFSQDIPEAMLVERFEASLLDCCFTHTALRNASKCPAPAKPIAIYFL